MPPRKKRTIDDDEPQFRLTGICHMCIHRQTIYTCRAFPDGIPFEILRGDFVHTNPYAGDRGIQFEKSAVTLNG